MQKENSQKMERAPVVAVMGHIDHGKSTLLSYIRKSTKPLDEAGGITQHISAYEVEHVSKDGKKHSITFIDTPGHAAFSGIRKRGAAVADVAVLVVSAEDGVKPQTLEALTSIKNSNTPYIVAINKIDKPEANIERTKQSLAENEIYIEGYGGDVPAIAISSKTGEGVPELLDMIILVGELEELKGDPNKLGQGIIIESGRDIKKGISATCIVKDGVIEKGNFVASGTAIAPIRIMENFLGRPIDSAIYGKPIKIIGWDNLPIVGGEFTTYKTRDEARAHVEKEILKAEEEKKNNKTSDVESFEDKTEIPIIIKADTASSLEAVIGEINKLKTERVVPRIVLSGIGLISENDILIANSSKKAVVIGFNVKIDSLAKNLSLRNEIDVKTFEIIYKMSEWLKEEIVARTPKVSVEESIGTAKILKVFSKVKDRQILGGRVLKGSINVSSQVKIIRRDAEIGQGKVRELQQQKNPSSEVKEGSEFGAMIEAKVEILPGDHIECFTVVEK